MVGHLLSSVVHRVAEAVTRQDGRPHLASRTDCPVALSLQAEPRVTGKPATRAYTICVSVGARS
eukprot:3206823-Prymnesium_polylepis.1